MSKNADVRLQLYSSFLSLPAEIKVRVHDHLNLISKHQVPRQSSYNANLLSSVLRLNRFIFHELQGTIFSQPFIVGDEHRTLSSIPSYSAMFMSEIRVLVIDLTGIYNPSDGEIESLLWQAVRMKRP